MSHSNFKYCPFCGAHMLQDTMVKYCPFCGGKFLLSDNKNQESLHDEQVIVQDQVPQKRLSSGDNAHMEFNIDNCNKMNRKNFYESEYYSIILKDAPNKQGLVDKLEKVLLRGSFAIRLAVDNIPSIIIYKAKGKHILDFTKIFMEEQASVSVIAGDFNNKPLVEELFDDFDKLSVQTQQIIKNMPVNLWLGDTIHGIFAHIFKDNIEGVMIITEQNIYFIPNNISTLSGRWFVRSYNLLSKIVMHDEYLELSYKGMKVTSITFADSKMMADAYQSILHAVQIY